MLYYITMLNVVFCQDHCSILSIQVKDKNSVINSSFIIVSVDTERYGQ